LIFVDTSALLAFLDRDAEQHERVRASMAQVLHHRDAITHNYVLVESEALAHRRLGGRAVRALLEDLVPALKIVWVDAELHDAAIAAHLRALRRRSSLVDHVSFELMRRLDLRTALALDDDFAREGFELLSG
jgi:predicted nucleic acid-binding protein